MNRWSELVGQEAVVRELKAAAAAAKLNPVGPAMTHAWLITGPPGSGRSVTGEVFATALVCPEAGCGECDECRLAAARTHPDIEVINPEGLSYRTSDARELTSKAAYAPIRSPWHVIVLEDADRLTDTASNVLLKSIEEPSPRTVWILCVPSTEDVLPTIRSRCRHVPLRTPSTAEVAAFLVRTEGVDLATGKFAARAAQGHIGRARALVRDHPVRVRRQRVLEMPRRLTNLIGCMEVAAELMEVSVQESQAIAKELDELEREQLRLAWGEGSSGRKGGGSVRGFKKALKDLEDRQASRRTRTQRDQLDRVLLDLLSYYRDVLVAITTADAITVSDSSSVDSSGAAAADDAASGNGVTPAFELVNEELRAEIEYVAATTSLNSTLLRIRAIENTRQAFIANVAPQLALEAMVIRLRDPLLRDRSTVE